MLSVVAIVVVLGGLIFFHELGHFIAARALGIGVKAFSLGFGPRLVGFRHGRTDYKVSLLPLGGYVSLVGEKEESDLPEGFSAHESFSLRPPWHRMLVVAAGPLFNILLAVFLCVILFFFYGKTGLAPELSEVVVDSPAAQAGLAANDKIVAADGKKIVFWDDFSAVVEHNGGSPIELTVERNGTLLSFQVTPKLALRKNIFGEEVMAPMIGIVAAKKIITEPVGAGSAIVLGFERVWDMVALTVQGIIKLVDRTIPLDNVGGPVFIAQLISEQSDEGLVNVLALAAFISVNLGLLNLLPIPVLDGGHILFLAIESVRRKPLSLKVQAITMQIGLVALLALFALAMYNDLARIFSPA